ncbi:arginine deiminase-related protein [Chryseobacterium sp.]|nr:arginine deiminase-related protein [Chryseobacterium sp.]
MFNQICLQEIDLNTIEVNGGGSARCMLAEVFLPKK